MLLQETKEYLQQSKNLLAFSAGVDSTALFFLLLENHISFDIAIVDYGVRPQSREELAYAQELAEQHSLRCYSLTAPKITSNFEANARALRYNFFEELITQHNYNTLLTAHHLGDRFEWMMMQFCKGAGCAELSGMQEFEKRPSYTLLRPLLHLDKEDLRAYLTHNHIRYFEDESNSDERYKRNKFRKILAPLLDEYKDGIKKSFQYIEKDTQELIQPLELNIINQLAYFISSSSIRNNIYTIDKYLKSIGHIMSAKERLLLEKEQSSIIGRKYIVTKHKDYTLIAPYIKAVKLSKEFKEKMRLLKIEPKLRGYLASNDEAVEFLSELFA